MTVNLAGSGVATSCAAALLSRLAVFAEQAGLDPSYVEHVRDELIAEFKELTAQRDAARNSAIAYAEGKLIDSSWGSQEYAPTQ